ncbi:hypothetical protein HDU83_004613 [Entophlyctis luteolus]|nr:hypothetical protein HDU83_004613 [Entophlyctis luteolus]KAJ3388335.1 hypothetical protein HDU84_009849 [Entophlyctis sp. JEL0112]
MSDSASPARPRSPEWYLRLFIFATIWISAAVIALIATFPAVPLRLARHSYYRACVRQIQRAIGSLVVIVVALFLPGSRLVLTGDFDRMRPYRKQIVISNHQIYPDWIYLWMLAWTRNCHADFRAVAMKALGDLPLFGLLLKTWQFILVHRNREKDTQIIEKDLQLVKNSDYELPLWLVIFPEGGLNWSGGVEKSKKYAEKMGISPHPKYVILPKSMGLFLAIKNLDPLVKDVFDVTIAYEGLDGKKIPYDTYLPEIVFFDGVYPRNVHMHVRRFSVANIPGFKPDDILHDETKRLELFSDWLHSVWMEKDARMALFYQYGELSLEDADEPRMRVPLVPHSHDWMSYAVLIGVAYMLWPAYSFVIRQAVSIVWATLRFVMWLVGDVVGLERTVMYAIFFVYFAAYLRGES